MNGPSFGLLVSPAVRIRRVRRLPIQGAPIVAVGDKVSAEEVVATASLPGQLQPIDASRRLRVSPDALDGCLRIREGETIFEGQLLAEARGWFGFSTTSIAAPCSGTVASISLLTGSIVISKTPSPLELMAYLSGEVAATAEDGTVEIEAVASLVQGVFGLGGECYGRLLEVEHSENGIVPLHAEEMEEAVVFSKAPLGYDDLAVIRERKARGAVCGAVPGKDLVRFAGRTLNPACTGDEGLGLTIVLTEGFGQSEMSPSTLALLRELQGARVSASGITQVRAGVIRPEIVGPPLRDKPDADDTAAAFRYPEIGDRVRIVRGRHFGRTGVICDIPSKLRTLDFGIKTLVYELEMSPDERLIVPRTNVEPLGSRQL